LPRRCFSHSRGRRVEAVGPLVFCVWGTICFHGTAAVAQTGPPASAAPPSVEAPPTTEPPPANTGQGATFGQFGAPVEITAPDDRATLPILPPDPQRPKKADKPRFGDAGQFALVGGLGLSIGSASFTNSEASTFAVNFSPSLEYFIVRNISVGLELELSYVSSKGYVSNALQESKDTLYGGGVHLGANYAFSSAFSVYPLLSAGFHRIIERYELPNPTGSSNERTRTGPWVEIFLPFLYHPVEHFFVGLGPSLYHDLSHAEGGWGGDEGVPRTILAARFVVGGYFDPSEAQDEEGAIGTPEESAKSQARFGDVGTFVLTEETSFSWRSVGYSGDFESTGGFHLGAGADWFFTRHQSLGGGAGHSEGSTLGFPPGPSKSAANEWWVSARYGFLVPFYSWFYVYPRLSFAYEHRALSIDTGTASTRTDENIVSASITAPAIVELARHFFIGVGPFASEDVIHTQEGASLQTRRTAYGATTLIGGWF
jgi:hypothetical protein